MAKVRVYQLAKDLNVQSALILELLDRMGHEVKSDLSTLDSETAELVRIKITSAIAAERERVAHEHDERAPIGGHETGATTTEESVPPPVSDEAPVSAPGVQEQPMPAAAASTPSAKRSTPALPKSSESPAAAAAAANALAGKSARKPRVFPAKRVPPPAALGRKPAAPPSTAPRTAGPTAPRPYGPAPGSIRRPAPGAPGKVAPGRKRRKKDKKERQAVAAPPRVQKDLPPVPAEIVLSEGVTVKELAEKLNRKSKDVIAKLIPRGVLATINQPLEPDVAIDVAKEFGSEAKIISFEEEAQQSGFTEPAIEVAEDAPEHLIPRPPVVTVMGHVDHGKTSLLDAVRETSVVDTEAGGITQHIGAYQVEARGRKITFLDTPGHEAFTLMRARGAKATDIVVLVVAADDGVKPQTLEAIDHARAAGVPIVVAINKIDKPTANAQRVKQQLADRDVLIEEYGGDVVSCEVSAKQRIGIDELLEMVLLVADLKDLKANPDKPATGVVLEARLDRGRGVLATVLVLEGTLKAGDPFIAGSAYGKVRAMNDDKRHRVESAGPAMPVEVMGFADEPSAGDAFQSVADEAKARQIASFRRDREREAAQGATARRSLQSLAEDIAAGAIKELPILLKTDFQGSLEALRQALNELPSDKVRVTVLRSSIGAITQADVLLAAASDAIVVGFNVRPDKTATEIARAEHVELRMYTVIYDVIDDIKKAMLGLLEPTLKEVVLGQAQVRQLFRVPKTGTIAGCYVTDGKVTRNSEVRLLRDNVVIHTGKIGSLKRFKDDVSEVKQGFECGIGLASFNDLKDGDVIESFVMEKVMAESL